jgi:hypothetical protein
MSSIGFPGLGSGGARLAGRLRDVA